MKIVDILVGEIYIPLKKPFKTALREVSFINDIIVKIVTDTECEGYGEAPPTALITGDTKESICSAVLNYIKPAIIGIDIENFELIMTKINNCIYNNTSAKAAVDMAVYDLLSKHNKKPLYKLLGGSKNTLKTDITISLNTTHEMIMDSLAAIELGFSTLKIKIGKDFITDTQTIKEIRNAVGKNIVIRVDANQGFSPKEAVRVIRTFEDLDLDIELVEQPVKADDINGLKFVTDNVLTPILADESIFSVKDAITIIKTHSADLINIKLMKTGGIYNALKICMIAESYGIKCMIGCMLEGKIGVSAAAHLACSKDIISFVDLDCPNLCKTDPFNGGIQFDNENLYINNDFGLGFKNINDIVRSWASDKT